MTAAELKAQILSVPTRGEVLLIVERAMAEEMVQQRHGFYPDAHNSQGWVKTQRAAFHAGQASGFSLGTEAAAKYGEEWLTGKHGFSHLASGIRQLRYEDVKGEKDGE